jgi:hypothetical protein
MTCADSMPKTLAVGTDNSGPAAAPGRRDLTATVLGTSSALPDWLQDLGALGSNEQPRGHRQTEHTLIKRNNRPRSGEPRRPIGKIRRLTEDELLTNGAFWLTCQPDRPAPELVPGIAERTSRSPADEPAERTVLPVATPVLGDPMFEVDQPCPEAIWSRPWITP